MDRKWGVLLFGIRIVGKLTTNVKLFVNVGDFRNPLSGIKIPSPPVPACSVAVTDSLV